MRIALVLVIALAGCAKKSAPAKSPASQTMENKAAPGGADGAAADEAEDDSKGSGQTKGDPCDGGENKNKKK
jgi:hypothetical protein